MSIIRQMDKEDVVHIFNGILLSYKKSEISTFVTAWVNLDDIVLGEISQTEKDKYQLISLIYEIYSTK